MKTNRMKTSGKVASAEPAAEMRQLQQQEQEQEQRTQAMSTMHHHHHERNIIVAFIAIAAVIVLGFFMAMYLMNIISDDNDDKGKGGESRYYNGFEFVKKGNTWFTEWERGGTIYSLEFRHGPWEVENIPVRGSVDARFQLSYIFITHDPTNESSRATAFVALAAADLTMFLRGVFEREGIAPACTVNLTEACARRPVVTCSTNASVIYLKASNETGIFLDGNCVTVQGFEENMTRAADKAIYQWLGIIKK